MSLALFGLGATVAKLTFRAWNLTNQAGAVGDASDAVKLSASWWSSRRSKRLLQREIDAILRMELGNQPPSGVRRQAIRALHADVGALLEQLLATDDALVQAVVHPDQLTLFDRLETGTLRRSTEFALQTYLDRLLIGASTAFARAVENAPGLSAAATAYTLQTLNALDARSVSTSAFLRNRLAGETLGDVERLQMDLRTKTGKERVGLHARTLRERNRLPLLQQLFDVSVQHRALLGDGGMGKSVLAGEVVTAAGTERLALLVRCDRVTDPTATSVDDIDKALGVAAGADGYLSHAIAAVASGLDRRPLVVIDTLDIITRDNTASQVDAVLSRVAQHAELFITCRQTEWVELLANGPFCSSIAARSIYPLAPVEVVAWVTEYAAGLREAQAAKRFIESVESALKDPRAIDVLGVPLRLAMACGLYAEDGALPPGLTASRLYEEYWANRIHADRYGRITQESDDAETAADRVAATIWESSIERFVQQVPAPEMTNAARRHLLSDGILDARTAYVSFFHQTFAEFAVARHLTFHGSVSDWDRLGEGMAARRSGYWAIAGHVMRRVDLSETAFDLAAAAVPNDAAGAHTVLGGLLLREDDDTTRRWWEEFIDKRPERVAACAELLLGASARHDAYVLQAVRTLLPTVTTNLTTIVRVYAERIRVMPGASAKIHFEFALGSLLDRHSIGDPLADSEIRRLIDAVLSVEGPAQETLFNAAASYYEVLPEAGRAGFLLAAASSARLDDAIIALNVAALVAVPSDAFNAAVQLSLREGLVGVADSRWGTWRDIVIADHPPRWLAVLNRALCLEDAGRIDVEAAVALALDPEVTRVVKRNATGMVRHIAIEFPSRLAETLLTIRRPSHDKTWVEWALLLSRIAPALTGEWAGRVHEGMLEAAVAVPDKLWSSVIGAFANDGVKVQRTIERFIEVSATDPTTLERHAVKLLDAMASKLPSTILVDQEHAIHWLSVKIQPIPLRTAVRLAAAQAPRSREARDRAVALAGRERTLQSDLVRMSKRRRHEWDAQSWSADGLSWTITFLDYEAPSAVIDAVEVLRPEIDSPGWDAPTTEHLVSRLVRGVLNAEEQQLTGKLLELLGDVSNLSNRDRIAPTPLQCQRVLAAYRTALDETSPRFARHRPAIFSQITQTMTDVCKRRLPSGQLLTALLELVRDVDSAAIGARATTQLQSTIGAIARAFPIVWDRSDDFIDHAPEGNVLALAEAAKWVDDPGAATFLERLASASSSTPAVVAFVQQHQQQRR
ncbi:NACHT domain-containing protein [Frondihabitans cladoniiphilus]